VAHVARSSRQKVRIMDGRAERKENTVQSQRFIASRRVEVLYSLSVGGGSVTV
jgi:hypothetical protein